MAPQKKESQFAAATARLGKQQNMNMKKAPVASPVKKSTSKTTWNGHQSSGNLRPSPTGVMTGGVSSKNKKLAPPPFVSPGAGASKKSATSSYLNKPTGTRTPTQASKSKFPSSPGFGGLAFSPSPSSTAKPKLSFQAQSPTARISNKPKMPATTYYGGSYLNKGNDNQHTKPAAKPSDAKLADVKIVVKSDIQDKLRARQRANGKKLLPPVKKNNEPEHIRRAREREERRLNAAKEKEYRAALLVQAAFLGWYARIKFLRMLEANIERLEQIRREEAYLKKRDKAILTIQSTFRMFVRRKRYVYVRDCKRRRERNQKEMKKIAKTIKGMPKQTKADIKELKKEYEAKKTAYKKSIRKRLKEEDDKMEEIGKTGADMIKYWENQNDLVKQQKAAIKKEQKVLEGQFELLTAKSEEIHENFKSLQEWVVKKNEAIKKHEAADQKCRVRYLPKYREDIAQRNKICMVEHRIKEMYKKEVKKAIKAVEKRSKDAILVKDLKKEMKACNKEIAAMPEVPVPEGLERWLK